MNARLSLFGLLVPFVVACGSSDGDTGSDMGAGNAGENSDEPSGSEPGSEETALECDPDAEIPCIEGIAEPCDYETGWLGDDYCLAVPDPSVGLQIHTGPEDYDNPDEVDQYVILPGEETNWAEVTKTPNTEQLYTDGYYSYMRPGSHHFILFSLPRDTYQEGVQSNADGAESAVGALDGEFRAGATKPIQGAILSSDDPAEQGGAAFEAERPIAMNLHFINTTQEPLLQEVWVNFHLIAREDIGRWMNPITWYGGLSMNVPPGTQQTVSNKEQPCQATSAPDAQINVMTGHVHANTVRYNAVRIRDGQEQVLFEDYNWADPTQFMFLPGYDYPEPNPTTKIAGVGETGPLDVQPGDQYYWECEVHNEHEDVFLTFGNQVYTGEMCIVFGFYSTPQEERNNWLCAF